MSSEALHQLRAMAQGDDELRAALQAAATREDVIRIAADHGISIDASDLVATSELPAGDLDDADLELIAGGWHPKYGTFSDDCN